MCRQGVAPTDWTRKILRHMTPGARGHLAMLCFSALVAGSFSLGALAAPLVDPAALSVLRFALAGCLMGAVAALSPRVTAQTWADARRAP
jgi:drug/metabolite transporter (DMT)-like permease